MWIKTVLVMLGRGLRTVVRSDPMDAVCGFVFACCIAACYANLQWPILDYASIDKTPKVEN